MFKKLLFFFKRNQKDIQLDEFDESSTLEIDNTPIDDFISNQNEFQIGDLDNNPLVELSNNLFEKVISLSEEEIIMFVQLEIKRRTQREEFENQNSISTDDFDSLLVDACTLVVEHEQGSTSLIQRKMKLGYNRAGRIMDQMELIGIVGPFTGLKAREVMFIDLKSLNAHLEKMGILDSSSNILFRKRAIFREEVLPLYEDDITEKVDLYFKDLEEQKRLDEIEAITAEILAKDNLVKEKRRLNEKRREIEKALADQGLIDPIMDYRRESIPQDIKDQVWNRDLGRCVECGLSERLEFDHIIPISKGGANTYRNLQLLCERCNREKSNKIG